MRCHAAVTIGGMTGFLLVYFVAGQAMSELYMTCEYPTGQWLCTETGMMAAITMAIGSAIIAGAVLAAAAVKAAGCHGAVMTGLAAVPVLVGWIAVAWIIVGAVDVSDGVLVGVLLASLPPSLWLARRLGQAWHDWLLTHKAVSQSD